MVIALGIEAEERDGRTADQPDTVAQRRHQQHPARPRSLHRREASPDRFEDAAAIASVRLARRRDRLRATRAPPRSPPCDSRAAAIAAKRAVSRIRRRNSATSSNGAIPSRYIPRHPQRDSAM
jgi:hypothetical protein